MQVDTHINVTPRADGSWQERLAHIVETMRAISRHTDPQKLVADYRGRMRGVIGMDRMLSLTRRGTSDPEVIIARDSWHEELPNPWTRRSELPVVRGGLFADLIYGRDERILINDLSVEAGDPAAEYLREMRSMVAVPVFDGGESFNRVVLLRREANAFDADALPQLVWTTNLMGRLTHNLMLSGELRRAHDELKVAHDLLDEEIKVVAEIQRSLLPAELPRVPGLELAAAYRPATRAGGDYYDVFERPDGRWAILIADVSGHGSPAAVLMAITHSLTHSHPRPEASAAQMLDHINHHLTARYTHSNGRFVTAFIGLYDPRSHELTYASAGHHPPRVKACDGKVWKLDGSQGLPLGVMPKWRYEDAAAKLRIGDRVLMYTDGVTEAMNPASELFGEERLDAAVHHCGLDAAGIVASVIERVEKFSDGRAADDDRTLLAVRVVE